MENAKYYYRCLCSQNVTETCMIYVHIHFPIKVSSAGHIPLLIENISRYTKTVHFSAP